jgi:hypothetical protein
LCLNLHRWSPVISSVYETKLKRRMVDKICMKLLKGWYPLTVNVSFIAVFINRYDNRLLSLLWKLFFIPYINDEFLDLRTWWITYWLDQFCQNLITTWWFVSFHLFIRNFSLKGTRLGTNSSAVCIFVLTSLTPCTFSS